jgi:hypothetical protein
MKCPYCDTEIESISRAMRITGKDSCPSCGEISHLRVHPFTKENLLLRQDDIFSFDTLNVFKMP